MTWTPDREIRIWDLKAADPSAESRSIGRAEPAWGPTHGLAISPNNRWLVTVGGDSALRLWNLESKEIRAKPRVLMEHVAGNHFVTPDGRWFVIGGSNPGAIGVWDLAADDPAMAGIHEVLRPDRGYSGPQGISPDGRWLVGVGASSSPGRRLWDLRAKKPFSASIAQFKGTDEFRSMDFSLDSRWLAAGGDDGETRLFDMKSKEPGTKPMKLGGHEKGLSVGELAFSPNGRWLITGGRDETVRVWDMNTITQTPASAVLRGHADCVEFLSISPDSRWLVTAAYFAGSFDPDARLWDLESKDPASSCTVLPGHDGAVQQVAFSDRWVITKTSHNTALFWAHGSASNAAAHGEKSRKN
jgi:WD40 repeat protein